jgi:hypothetical protein
MLDHTDEAMNADVCVNDTLLEGLLKRSHGKISSMQCVVGTRRVNMAIAFLLRVDTHEVEVQGFISVTVKLKLPKESLALHGEG